MVDRSGKTPRPVKTAWYESEPYVQSSGRIGHMIGYITGAAVALGGLVGWFLLRPDALLVIASGLGIFSASYVAKNIQGNLESRSNE